MTSIKVRAAKLTDLEGLIQLELERYGSFHKELGTRHEDLTDRFTQRINNLSEFYLVATDQRERIVGSMSGLPTNHSPIDFVSWEQTTCEGTCKSYDHSPKKDNLYIVNLDILESYSKSGAQFALMNAMAVKVLRYGYKQVFFESRLPGLRNWIKKTVGMKQWSKLSKIEKLQCVNEYISSNGEDGRPLDQLVSFFTVNGFKATRVVENAFNDPESLNYGVIFYAKNKYCFKLSVVNLSLSLMLKTVSKLSPRIVEKII